MNEQHNEERERAERESKNCPRCYGDGMVIVFHPDWDGKKIEPGGFPLEVGAHCHCPIGQWKRGRLSSEVRERIPDGRRIVAGRSIWSFEPPDDGTQDIIWNEEEGREWLTTFQANGGAKALVKSPR